MSKEFSISQECLKAICALENSTIMVLGGSDTGKTILVEYLADLLAKKFRVGIVDCDMGQSHIGPPTTIAWGRSEGLRMGLRTPSEVGEGFTGWENIKVEDFYFTGSLSPYGNLLPTICGTKIIYDKAKKGCDKIIIDTTGLIDEPSGRILKENKIDLIKPNIILALQRENELEHILAFTRAIETPLVFRVAIPEAVTRKTMAMRASYRKELFTKYFNNAKEIEVPLEYIGIRKIGSNIRNDLTGRLASLRNKNGDDIALGIIKRVGPDKITLISPLREIKGVGCLVIGEAKI